MAASSRDSRGKELQIVQALLNHQEAVLLQTSLNERLWPKPKPKALSPRLITGIITKGTTRSPNRAVASQS